VLNVYVHYLREKLEDGKKIIISSRKLGYKIDERYLTPDDRNGDKKC
jgi:DNA-binding response OmpR family regulator